MEVIKNNTLLFKHAFNRVNNIIPLADSVKGMAKGIKGLINRTKIPIYPFRALFGINNHLTHERLKLYIISLSRVKLTVSVTEFSLSHITDRRCMMGISKSTININLRAVNTS